MTALGQTPIGSDTAFYDACERADYQREQPAARTIQFDALQRAWDDGELTLHDLFHLVLDLGEEVVKLSNAARGKL